MVATVGTVGVAQDLDPVGLLAPVWTPHSYETKSVGTDGWLYGAKGGATNPNTLIRSGDSWQTVETGFDFGGTTIEVPTEEGGTELGGALLWATRTTDGYVAMTVDIAADTGKLWHSSSFATGWSVKLNCRAANRISISRPITGPNGKTYLFVGEYNTGFPSPSPARKLWGSFDGGLTWTLLRTMTEFNAGQQAHWHCVTYDLHMRRIWAAAGDGFNAWVGYSDNEGSTWVPVLTDPRSIFADSGGTYQQPTVFTVVGHRVFNCPDRGSTWTGVFELDRRTGANTVAYGINGVFPFQQWGRGPHALTDRECYIIFPQTSVPFSNRLYCLATGDAGRTWHLVYERVIVGSESWSQGIVGPDINNKLYIPGAVGGVAGTLIAPALAWAA